MTRERLENYISNRSEIAELNYKLEHLNEDDRYYSTDTVYDYRTGYGKPISITGVDTDRRDKDIQRWTALRDQLTADCDEVVSWVESIPDGVTRRILRMRYLEGQSMDAICAKVYVDRSTAYRRIERALEEFG